MSVNEGMCKIPGTEANHLSNKANSLASVVITVFIMFRFVFVCLYMCMCMCVIYLAHSLD